MSSPSSPSGPPALPNGTASGRRERWRWAVVVGVLGVLGLVLWGLFGGAKAPPAEHATTGTLPTSTAALDAAVPEPPRRELSGDRSLAGFVRDDRGQPLAEALVRVSSVDDPDTLPKESRSDAQGAFRIEGLPAEPLTIEASAIGHDTVEHVVRPEDQGPLALVLPRQGELLVVLRDSPGRPVSGSEVMVTGTGLWPAATCTADEQGQCLFESLPGGQYQARARREDRVGLPSATLEVTPGQRARLELTLQEGSRVEGVLTDKEAGRVIAGARVSVQDLTPGLAPIGVITGPDGVFAVVGLWPGNVRVEASAEGFAPESVELRLPSKDKLALALHGLASLSGSVVDESGRGVAGVLLSVSSREGLPVAAGLPLKVSDVRASALAIAGDLPGELGVTQGPVPRIPLVAEHTFALGTLAAESAADGAFRIEGLKPGSIVLRASRPGYAPVTLTPEPLAPHAERRDVRIVLREAGRVEGRVYDARERGVGGVYVAAFQGDQAEQTGLTDERGEFVLRDLLGPVTVRVQPEGRDPLVCEVNVPARGVARCNVSIASELFRLPVRVVDDYGFGLDGAVVSLKSAESKRAFTQVSQRDGRVQLRELPAPPYLLGVELTGYLPLVDEPVDRAEQEVRVTLRKSAKLAGTVVDAIGHPVPGAFVSTDDGDATTETDEHGAFALTQVAPGALTVWAAHPEVGEGRSAEVRARAGETLASLRVVLPKHYSGETRKETETHKETETPRTQPRERETSSEAPEETRATPTRAPEKPADFTMEQRPNAVVVAAVAPNGAAARAGMRVGDVLAAIDGEDVLSVAHARGMLRDPPNTNARVRLLRSRQPINVRYRRPGL
ncbi:MAG: carboxypeptidase regulatory-like domain-containing protein [Myxococcales bacterium]